MSVSSRLTFHESNHSYWLADPGNGKKRRVPSVSSLTKMLYPFDNDDWKVRQVAEAVADDWFALAGMAPTGRVAAMRDLGRARLNEAPDFGRAVHHYCEQLWTGEPVEVPAEYAGHVTSVAEWWDQAKPRVVHAEAACYADADDLKGGPMAGRLDLLVELPGWGAGLMDLKTWRSQSTGSPRPAQWAFQLAAYSEMDALVADGEDQRFPPVDWIGVLHVGPSRAQLWRAENWWPAIQQVDLARALKALPSAAMEELL